LTTFTTKTKKDIYVFRFQDDNAMYVEDSGSNRLSVLYRVEAPHQGTSVSTKMMKFMCLGSDVGGINRKPLKVVFTLEAGVGQVRVLSRRL